MQRLYAKIMEAQRDQAAAEQRAQRKSLVGSGDRSDKIRTYNYPQGRVTDHRIGLTLYDLSNIINGDIQKIIDELMLAENTEEPVDTDEEMERYRCKIKVSLAPCGGKKLYLRTPID